MNNKVTIIGAGSVGATIAYTLVATGSVAEIVLIDVNEAKARGEALDIRQATPYLHPVKIYCGTYEDAVGSDIVIITSGVGRKPGQSRIDLTQTNVNILKSIAPQIVKYVPDALYLFVANPVDILTYVFCKITGIPKNRVIGTGTTLDSIRLRTRLSELYSVNQKQVHAYVLGEHGDSSFVAWSTADISGIPLSEYQATLSDKDALTVTPYTKEEIEEYVKKSGGKIIADKGATFYGIAACVTQIVNSIYSSAYTILPVSSVLDGEYGISDVALSTLCAIGNEGIITRLTPRLSPDELEKMKHSAEMLKGVIAHIEIYGNENRMEYRIEKDTMGEMQVPADRYWAAQTQRSYQNFRIGDEIMPREITKAFGILKKAAALANCKLGKLSEEKKNAICAACDEVISGQLNGHFPLVVWQTGSGTQSNMNANEVIANRGNEIAGQKLLHPNDDINKSQSSNDTFPTAMHIAAVVAIEDHLFPAMDKLIATLKRLEAENEGIVKSGRTHLQDAVPIAFSQEISGWRNMIEKTKAQLVLALSGLKELALGGTAVGTGLNAPKGFAEEVAAQVSALTGKTFVTAENKYHALTAKDELVFAHGALKALACNLMKIANDVRWLASGPRDGLGEIFIPENEPGSSIMPGKVNPTQCESMTMVAVQVMANDVAVGVGASQGNFELNVFMPVIIYNFLQSVRLLSDGITSFERNCVTGIKANREKMHHNLYNSLMLVTALNPYIGYENAAKTAKKAYKENISLKEACVALGFLSAEEFDKVFRPEEMAYPQK